MQVGNVNDSPAVAHHENAGFGIRSCLGTIHLITTVAIPLFLRWALSFAPWSIPIALKP